ncbi:MAG TPA: TolC family protein [Burkholderiales bacterium]|nr:TolC family protein [Burkholderiales bacterium]
MAHRDLMLAYAMAAFLGGCSTLPYTSRPIDPEAAAASYQARSVDAEGLKAFAVANGYDAAQWPPAQWGLQELTLAALYFHPDIRMARARAAVARAELGSASSAPPWSARLAPEYHSRQLPEDKAPWSLGLQLEIPLVAQSKKAARVERGTFLSDAADLDVADAAWIARARVRDSYMELAASGEALALIDAQLQARDQLQALVARRVEAGLASAQDLGIERLVVSQLGLLRGQQAARRQRAQGELAAALGLPLDVVERMSIRTEVREDTGVMLDAATLQRLALRNRLDVHRKLLEFGAADAEVKAAVAAQNPEITLGPGYAWDQGDNVWSLAVGFTLPSGQARAGVREAQARRELAAESFAAIQAGAISAAQRAAAQVRQARDRVDAASRQLQLQREQEARIARQFDSGAADRVQRVGARLETLAAETVLQAARVEQSRATAGLEDAIQRPLLGDFRQLPDVRVAPATALANTAGTP